ncbi:MAG TPA: hypothetical protein VFZ58_02820 [Candidatus Saccharimonadales bacterium]
MLSKLSRNNRFMYVALIIIVLLAIGTAGFFAKKYFDLRANPGQAAEEETARLTNAVGKLYELPKDETPIIGKVQDKEKLKDQPFFKNAENSDDILIYQKAKVAIIYRAKENKLINVGPIAIDAAQQGQAAATVKVFNATTKTGAVDTVLKSVGEIAGLQLDQTVGEAKSKSGSQIIVVDINGNKGEPVKQVAEKLGGIVGSLPAGESKPSVDIAVFVGGK